MDAAGDVLYADRHPVVSLVSACFWVICTYTQPFCVLCRKALTNVCSSADISVGIVMGKGTHCVRDDNGPQVDLRRVVVVDDTYCG